MNIFKRLKWFYGLLGLLLLGGTAFGQNYVSGLVGVYGATYNAATTVPTGGQVLVGTAGNWWFGGIAANRGGTGTFTFNGTGTYGNALAASYANGTVSRTGSSADFTFPTGDAGATAGGVYHPLLVSAASTTLTSSVIYNASSTTPNPTLLATGVVRVDPIANWGFTSTAATGTVSIVTRDETSVLTGNIYVAGYNTGTNKWEKVGASTAIVAGGQTLVSTAGIALAAYSAFTAGSEASAGVLVSPKVFLQGAMNGTLMTTALHNYIPTAQPYNTSAFTYAGTETLATIPTNMTDWVLVDLRDATTPTTIVATRAALLMSDGSVTDVDGVSPVSFPTQVAGSYFVGIRHRNHLAIRSASVQALSGTVTAFDFRQAQNTAYQNTTLTSNPAMKDLGNGLFAMYGGNVNGNTTVRYGGASNDETSLLSGCLSGNTSGIVNGTYSNCDVNMNGVLRYGGASNDETFLLSTVLGGNASALFTNHL